MDIADKIKFLRTNILDLSQEKFAKKSMLLEELLITGNKDYQSQQLLI